MLDIFENVKKDFLNRNQTGSLELYLSFNKDNIVKVKIPINTIKESYEKFGMDIIKEAAEALFCELLKVENKDYEKLIKL